MKTKKIFIYFLFLNLTLAICAPPPHPLPEPIPIIVDKTSKIFIKVNNSPLPLRILKETTTYLQIMNSTFTKIIHDDYITIEHTLILFPQNLLFGYSFSSQEIYSLNLKGISLEILLNTCEVVSIHKSSSSECKATSTFEGDQLKLIYDYTISNGDSLIFHYKYNYKIDIKEILFITQSIRIPEIKGSFCNYKLIIPDGYINLGLKNNLLKKESDTIYSYIGECNNKTDEIRYSPVESSWKADIGFYLGNHPEDNVCFIFPRYYIGGKLEISDYKIISTENKLYNADSLIYEDINFKACVQYANKEKVGVELHTIFSNKLTNDFKVNLPEKFYEIDLSKIDQEIIDKTKEIINEDSDKPNYYKIGKFVNSYITYDSNMIGRNLTLKQIYEGKKGVCEHITLLYNAMLNSIGIKTLYISGWDFQGNKTYGDKYTSTHAWTAALINGKWIELDATWGLFEGISACHIFKNFFEDEYICSGKQTKKNLFYKTHFIQMVTDKNYINYKEKKVLIYGIIFGVCIILCVLFLIYRKNKNARLYSKFIEENIDINGNNSYKTNQQ